MTTIPRPRRCRYCDKCRHCCPKHPRASLQETDAARKILAELDITSRARRVTALQDQAEALIRAVSVASHQ